MRAVWTCHSFKDNFGTKHLFDNYFKESCIYSPDKQISIKYFINVALLERYHQSSQALLVATGINGLNGSLLPQGDHRYIWKT